MGVSFREILRYITHAFAKSALAHRAVPSELMAMQCPKKPRILIIQVKRIGDLVLTAPLVASLRSQLPEAHLTVLSRGVAGKLAPLLPGIDESIVLKEGSANFGVMLALSERKFDIVLDLSANDRSALATLVSGASTRVTFEKWQRPGLRGKLYNFVHPGGISKRYIVDFFLEILKPIGLEPLRVPSALKLPKNHAAMEERISHWKRDGRKLVVIHPGTTEMAKYWSPEGWAAVVDHLKKDGRCSVVVSRGMDPFELKHIEEIKSHAESEIDFDDFITLPELVTVMHHCDIALGVDTGAMHIAALAEVPQVVFYNFLNWIQWRPRHQNARILRAAKGDPVDTIPISDALAAIDELLAPSLIPTTSFPNES